VGRQQGGRRQGQRAQDKRRREDEQSRHGDTRSLPKSKGLV
jgi:hypothetical protein